MNKLLLVLVVSLSFHLTLFSQRDFLQFPAQKDWKGKAPINFNDLDTWPKVKQAGINQKGTYFFATIRNFPQPGAAILQIRSVDTLWQKDKLLGFNKEYECFF
ncbi:MAG: hypothetical protein DI539_27475, partial [Flavobacterium psychrophilum]